MTVARGMRAAPAAALPAAAPATPAPLLPVAPRRCSSCVATAPCRSRPARPTRTARSTSPSSSRSSGAAAAGTRRSRTSCAASRRAATPARCGSRRRGPPRDGEDVDAMFSASSGRSPRPSGSASTAGAARTSRVATGWQTVPRVLRAGRRRPRLPRPGPRARVLRDVRRAHVGGGDLPAGLHCICAWPWLAELVRSATARARRRSTSASTTSLLPPGGPTRDDLVLFYARAVTPRRAVPLVLLALAELHRRRPDVEIALFGEARRSRRPSPTATSACSRSPRSPSIRQRDRRRGPLYDEPLADPDRDARVRPPGRGRCERCDGRRSARRPGRARGARPPGPGRRDRAAARRPRAARERRARPGPSSWRRGHGRAAAAQVEEGLRAALAAPVGLSAPGARRRRLTAARPAGRSRRPR